MKRLVLVLGVAVSLACTNRSPTGPMGGTAPSTATSESTLSNRPVRRAPRVVRPRTRFGPPVSETDPGNPSVHQGENVGPTEAHPVTIEGRRERESGFEVPRMDIRR
jgi:hypothetical protein